MRCFVCGNTADSDSAEVYSFEFCMCKKCKEEYVKWCLDQGVDPNTAEVFPEHKETIN